VLRLGLLGASGKMGREVSECIKNEFSRQAELIALVSGRSLLEGESKMSSLLETDAVIDFSSPDAVCQWIQASLPKNSDANLNNLRTIPPCVIGSTGWNEDQKALLQKLAKATLVLESANFSEGVFILNRALKQAGAALREFGYTAAITETHHIHKKDSPSGTAIRLQQTIESAMNTRPEVHSVRSGEVIGTHAVLFSGPADEIHLSHIAHNRSIFARGAIRAALWLASEKKKYPERTGFLTIEDYFDAVLTEKVEQT